MNDIQSFIQQRRAVGESEQDIASELLGAGWDREVIRAAMRPQQPMAMANPAAIANSLSRPNRLVSDRLIIVAVLVLGLIIIVLVMVFINGSDPSQTTSNAQVTTPTTSVDESLPQQIPATNSGEVVARDTQRVADTNRLLAEAQVIADAEGGRLPEPDEEGVTALTTNLEDFVDPQSGAAYAFTRSIPGVGEMQYSKRVICIGAELGLGSQRSVAVRTQLESGELYCLDNS